MRFYFDVTTPELWQPPGAELGRSLSDRELFALYALAKGLSSKRVIEHATYRVSHAAGGHVGSLHYVRKNGRHSSYNTLVYEFYEDAHRALHQNVLDMARKRFHRWLALAGRKG